MKPKKPRPRKPRERPDLRRLAAPPPADFYRLPELELRGGNLLNRFFPFQCILTKERNALRLDDALLPGSW